MKSQRTIRDRLWESLEPWKWVSIVVAAIWFVWEWLKILARARGEGRSFMHHTAYPVGLPGCTAR